MTDVSVQLSQKHKRDSGFWGNLLNNFLHNKIHYFSKTSNLKKALSIIFIKVNTNVC